MIKRILIPLDGSEHAAAALRLGADLATRYSANLDILHVSGRSDGEAADTATDSRDDEERGSGLLRAATEQARDRGAKNVNIILDYGDPGKRILHHVTESDTDVVVMGTRGLGGFARLALGSVSNKVFHMAPCSCAMVHEEGAFSTADGPKKILAATDGSEAADRAVGFASDLANRYGAELALLYVIWRGPSLDELRSTIDMERLSKSARDELDPTLHPVAEHISASVIPPVISRDTLHEIAEQVLERSSKAAKAKGVAEPKSIVLDTDPTLGIVNTAEKEGVELLVMGSRGLSGVEGIIAGSVSYKVLNSAPASCIVVR